MKVIKIIGLLCLICFTFFYTEKIIDVATEQDIIMVKIKEQENNYYQKPKDAIIDNDTIIPGSKGKEININTTYKKMKKIGYYNESLIVYQDVYPSISIYNNYHKYLIKGNQNNKNISLIYVLSSNKSINNILEITNKKNVILNVFIDSNYLNNNINIISEFKNHEIYNYGKDGTYTKDNLIITNNIINNKSNNKSIYCLFLKKDINSLENCANNKMFSIIPSINGNYNDIKNNLSNGSIILINNSFELSNIIDYIHSKGYNIIPLSNLITEDA